MAILVDLGIAVLVFAIGFLIFRAAVNLTNKENSKKDGQ